MRYIKVSCDRVLETNLDNIFIRGMMLYANIPKYNRVSVEKGRGCGGQEQALDKNTKYVSQDIRNNYVRREGRSFSTVVKENAWSRGKKVGGAGLKSSGKGAGRKI